jgi:hypothetical protein
MVVTAVREPVLTSPAGEASGGVTLLEDGVVEVVLSDAVVGELVEFSGMLAAEFKGAGFNGAGELEQSEAGVFLRRRFADGLA